MFEWPTREAIRDRLELTLRRAMDDKESTWADARWYRIQHDWLRSLATSPRELSQIAAVVATLSPQVSWEAQRKFIPGVIRALRAGATKASELTHPGFAVNKRKAIKCWNLAANPTGQKVSSFYQNLLYPNESGAVTVDSQILSAALGCSPSERPVLTKRRYNEIADIIRDLSDLTKRRAHEVQSIIWMHHRRNQSGGRTD